MKTFREFITEASNKPKVVDAIAKSKAFRAKSIAAMKKKVKVAKPIKSLKPKKPKKYKPNPVSKAVGKYIQKQTGKAIKSVARKLK